MWLCGQSDAPSSSCVLFMHFVKHTCNENGINNYCVFSYRYSLLVDPQGQANRWIRTMEKIHDLHIIKFSDRNYMKVIESAIELGKPVLLENVGEEFEAPLEPLLKKQIYHQGTK